MQNYNIIIEKLRNAKKNSGLTLKELAEKSNLTQGTVNKIMSGALKSIKTEKLQSLANALNVSLNDILFEQSNVAEHSEFYGFVRVATVTPSLKVGDTRFNADEIIRRAKESANDGVEMVLFPELCITGYTCEDLFFQNTLRQSAVDEMLRIAQELADTNVITIVGLPFAVNSRLYNVASVLYRGKVLGIVPKVNLPNYNEFSETRYFVDFKEGETTTVNINGYGVPFGSKLIFQNELYPVVKFAIEICEDVWVSTPPSCSHGKAGANIVFNLSASNDTVVKAEYRHDMVNMQSAKTGTAYVYCSAGPDESTSSTVFGGHDIIAENGVVLCESLPFTNGYAVADVDVDFLENERQHLCHEKPVTDYTTVNYSMTLRNGVERLHDAMPFVPADKKEMRTRAEKILTIQAYGLKKRIEHTHSQKLVIGVSGGSDSSLALVVCARALKLLGRPNKDIIAVTMPCFGTTERTKNNSIALAKAYGAEVKEIDITASVTQHLKDIGHDTKNTNSTYENAQARERTQVLMDIANDTNGLVIGTGDLSEIALGWSTFNGDQMSMYNVNSDVPKTLVKALLRFEAENSNEQIKRILLDVLDTPISPELLPNGAGAQITEDIIGPYELHDYFLFMLIRKGFSPAKTYLLAKLSFKGKYTAKQIENCLRLFIKRFFSQQFKRSASPDSVKIGSVSLGHDWQMPSDANPDTWLRNLDTVTEND